jgi:hypothetical protein
VSPLDCTGDLLIVKVPVVGPASVAVASDAITLTAEGGSGGGGGGVSPPHPGRRNAPTRVCQPAELVTAMYSAVAQNVHPSMGSTAIML